VIRATRKSGRNGGYGNTGHYANLTSGTFQFGQVFTTDITIGQQNVKLVIDTGSSDTWVVGSKFQCLDVSSHNTIPQKQCAFGSTWNIANDFKVTPNENFNITYGDGETLTGIVGTERVTLAGLTVPDQTIGVVNRAAWYGDGLSSGLLGLSFPGHTNAHTGNNGSDDSDSNKVLYNPLFTNMVKEHLTAPVFSIALDRPSASASKPHNYGGVLAIGGLPPVAIKSDFVTVPIEIAQGDKSYYWYTLTIDALVYSGVENTNFTGTLSTLRNKKSNTSFQAFVDSGTPYLDLPTAHSNAVNKLFDPPAVWSDDLQGYVTSCKAKVPEFGIVIGGKTFYINPLDNLVPIIGNSVNCTTGIVDGGASGLQTLGAVFMTNVVSVFDLGKNKMQFAQREFY